MQCSFCIRLDGVALKQHGMLLHLQPGLDTIIIMRASDVSGLSWRMPGDGGSHIGEAHDLTIGRHRDHHSRLVRRCRSHIDGIDITTYRERPSVKNPIERLDEA